MPRYLGRINIFILFIFFVLAVFITFPLIFHLADYATGLGDELLIAWNNSWNIYNFTFNLPNLLHIFNANIYFPYKNTLAFSEPFFTNSLIALIPVLILKSPIVSNNFNLIISLTLLGFSTFKLTFYLSKNILVSFLSGCLIIFSPAFLSWLVHIQIISIYFVPLSILFLIKFIDSKKTKFFLAFLISFILQIYNSFTPGFFIFLCSITILIFKYLEDKSVVKIFFRKQILIQCLITLCLVIAIAIPYFQVSKQFNYVRDIRDTIHFALQPEDLLVSGATSKLQPLLSNLSFTKDLKGRGEVKPGFLGLTFSALSIIVFIYFLRNWGKQTYVVKGLFASAILGLVLSLGPFLHIQRATIHNPFPIPLPYLLFYYLIPGFQSIRNSARFEVMFIILIAPIFGIYLNEVLKKIKRKDTLLIILGLLFLIILEFNYPIKFYNVPQVKDFPKIYTYLETLPKGEAVVHMPIYNWNAGRHSNDEVYREYYSTVGFNKMINGGSGFSPNPWQVLVVNLLKDFPSDDSTRNLKESGVTIIIVHKKEYDKLSEEKYNLGGVEIPNGDLVIEALNKNSSLTFLKRVEDDYVFRIK